MNKITELAKMIDHSVLHPTFTDEDLKRECEVAVKYNVASVCVKPYAVKMAGEYLKGSDVLNSCVIGFPHGNSAVEVKVFETEKAIRDGAIEIDMVVNIGKVLGDDWNYVEDEIRQIVAVTKKNNAVLKVIFENDYLTDDKYKIKLCQICSKLKVDFVKTSSGYGFVKGADGKYSYKGATIPDLKLMREYSDPEVQVKAAGGVRDLDDLLAVKEAGATRAGATATVAILEEAKKRFG
ncbi:MAG: deoxyribose-phosphate aldolase [Bacteroidales bacterium]